MKVVITNVSANPISMQDNRGRSIVLNAGQSRGVVLGADSLKRLGDLIDKKMITVVADDTPPDEWKRVMDCPKNPARAFFATGVGDFMAVTTFLTKKEMGEIKEVYLGTPRVAPLIAPLLPHCFPKYERHHVVVNDDVYPYPDTLVRTLQQIKGVERLMPAIGEITDYSSQIMLNQRRPDNGSYHPSPLMEKKVADVSSFGLPKKYVAINFSSRMHFYWPIRADREVTADEWPVIISTLKRLGLQGVIINWGSTECPVKDDSLIDLSNKIDILQGVEVVKGAQGFVGCASWPSVLASQIFPVDRMAVKTKWLKTMPHHCRLYYPALKDTSFIYSDLKQMVVR